MLSQLDNEDMMIKMLNKADEQKKKLDEVRDMMNNKKNDDEFYQDRSLTQLSNMCDLFVSNKIHSATEKKKEEGEESKWTCQSCNHTNKGGKDGTKSCGACNKVPAKWFLELERDLRPVDMRTVYGDTITSMAIKSGREDRLQLILKYKPNMNRIDNEGDTMLMSAVRNNRLDLIQMLLKYGIYLQCSSL
jgi:ankyrin repeat protein